MGSKDCFADSFGTWHCRIALPLSMSLSAARRVGTHAARMSILAELIEREQRTGETYGQAWVRLNDYLTLSLIQADNDGHHHIFEFLES